MTWFSQVFVDMKKKGKDLQETERERVWKRKDWGPFV
jgi:hypothetical protein